MLSQIKWFLSCLKMVFKELKDVLGQSLSEESQSISLIKFSFNYRFKSTKRSHFKKEIEDLEEVYDLARNHIIKFGKHAEIEEIKEEALNELVRIRKILE